MATMPMARGLLMWTPTTPMVPMLFPSVPPPDWTPSPRAWMPPPRAMPPMPMATMPGKRSADADPYYAYGAYGVPFGSSTGLDPITQGLDPVTQGYVPYYGYGHIGAYYG